MPIADKLELIDRIYEAGAAQSSWPDLLQEMSDSFAGAGAVLFTFGAGGSQRWTASPSLQERLEEFLRDGWAEKNQRPQRLADLNHFGFVNDLDCFTLEEIENDPVYRDYYPSRGLGWAAGTMVPVPSGDTLVFSFERAFKLGPFEDHELIALDELRPHLARAALLSSRFDLQRAQAMTSVLEAIGLPAAVLQQGGRLYAANASFQALIPSTIQDRAGGVMFADRTADAMLSDTLQRLEVRDAEGQSRSIPIPATPRDPAMIAHIAPIRGAANDIFARSRALIFLTPVDRTTVPGAEVLQGLFDLTPAEARVARAIAEGKTVDAISLSSGTSRETVRKQLAAVLSKTGLSRQAELVSLLSGKSLEPSGNV